MGATTVEAGATPLAFTHTGNQVQITLDRVYDSGELIDLIEANR